MIVDRRNKWPLFAHYTALERERKPSVFLACNRNRLSQDSFAFIYALFENYRLFSARLKPEEVITSQMSVHQVLIFACTSHKLKQDPHTQRCVRTKKVCLRLPHDNINVYITPHFTCAHGL